jgi:chromosome segregation ATPase
MPEDEPIDRHAPTESDDLKPSTKPPPESTTDPSRVLAESTKGDSYFASAAREFRDALVELRGTRADINTGFRNQSADLRIIRHEIQGIALRLAAVEEKQLAHAGDIADLKTGQRNVRADIRQLKVDLTNALERVSALEADLPKAQTSVPAPPAPSTGA